MTAFMLYARGARLARVRQIGAMGFQVADGGHLAYGHRATRGSAALPTAPVLR